MVVTARAMVHETTAGDALMNALLAMLVFAAIGYVVGRIAAWIVDDALRSKLLAELATREATSGTPAAESTA